MIRKLTAVFLLSFLIVAFMATTLVFGADKPVKRFKDRASFPARLAPVYNLDGADEAAFATPKNSTPVALGDLSSATAVGTQIGSTTYDYQHNCSMGRQVEHRGTNYVHFDWMRQDGVVLGSGRGIGAESYNLTSCGLVYGSGGKFATVDYGGYCTIDADQGGCAIPGGHEGADADAMRPRAYWDFCAGGPFGLFTSDFPSDFYGWWQNNGTGTDNQNLWPIVEMQVGTENVLHMVTAESGGAAGDPQTISYYRRVGAYGAGNGTWSDQRLIDTVMNINPIVTASATTDKVAIVWNAPVDYVRDTPNEFNSQYENDVWYAISSNQGADWISGIGSGSIQHAVEASTVPGANITQYQPSSDWKAYCDMAALITSDDNLHIVWGCRKWTDTTSLFRRQSAIFHWSQDVTSIRSVVKAEWDTGGACYAHAWGSDVAKMSISECDGKLYTLFTQFGNATAPCYDIEAADQYVNGELYMSVSGDNGLNWDRAQNLTNSETPDCVAGDCDSDYWASMSRFGRTEVCGPLTGQEVLDIVYINDKTAGGAIQDGSGVWNTNPVMWLRTPCRAVVEEPGYSDNAATGYGECYSDVPLVISPNTDTTITVTLENPGLLANNFSITVNYTDGSGWITPNPTSGVIASGLNNTIDVDLLFDAPTGAPDPSVWVAEIQITHDADGSPRVIPVCLMVASEFSRPEHATLSTTCKDFRVFNTGEVVNNATGEALDFNEDCDTFNVNTTSNIYLYDGSPIVTRVVGNDTLRYMMYSKTYTDPDAMRPAGPITTSTADPDYVEASAEFTTADTSIGFTVTYFAPTSAAHCDFVVERLQFQNLTASTMTGVMVGEFLDWDVPSDSGSNNGSGFDIGRNMIYQFGAEYDQDDSTEALCPQESDQRYAGMAMVDPILNAQTLNNAMYVYTTTSPWGNDAPLPAGPTYELMNGNSGFSTWSSTNTDSLYTDLSTLITFGEYDLEAGDKACIIKILATTKDGLTDLEAIIDDAYTWITDQGIDCVLTCCVTPGDANNDAVVNVGDAVYVINYVFKGGNAPPCLPQADANGDGVVNVGDAVYVINYVFKGGNAPICGPE